ncbi:MAG: metalloregulator ArsR/SmtB family transcription factor [Natronomonas sp.]
MADRDDRPSDCEFVLPETKVERLSERSVSDPVELFSTIGNETRYRILLFLTEAEKPVCGCELEPHFDVGQSSISQSLTRLHRADLVTRSKEGRWRYYEPTETASRLVALIEDNVYDEPLLSD